MDKLKNHLRQHEAEMQVETPDESRIWERIAAGRPQKNPPSRIMVWTRFAAAACILLLAGLGINQLMNLNSKAPEQPTVVKEKVRAKEDSVHNNQHDVALVPVERKQQDSVKIDVANEEKAFDAGYKQLVNLQMKRLRSTPVYAETASYFDTFKLQLRQMDKDEIAVNNDIKVYGLNDQLLEQLINIYQQKLQLLKTLQKEINKMNNQVQKDQPSARRHVYYINI